MKKLACLFGVLLCCVNCCDAQPSFANGAILAQAIENQVNDENTQNIDQNTQEVAYQPHDPGLDMLAANYCVMAAGLSCLSVFIVLILGCVMFHQINYG